MNKGLRITILTISFIIITGVSIWIGWYLSEKTNERRGIVTDNNNDQAYLIENISKVVLS